MANGLIAVLFFGAIFAAMVAAVVHAARGRRAALRLRATGVPATGKCLSLSWRNDEVSVHFSYVLPDGTAYVADSFHSSSTSTHPGMAVSLVYDPASPKNAELVQCLDEAIRVNRMVLIFMVPIVVLFAAFLVAAILRLFPCSCSG
jgi:hypothetical protein